MQLTPAQRDAVAYHGGHLQLLACAGSGKTEVLAQRIVALLDPERPDALTPRNIVAFTFTERAAAELKARIVRRLRERHGRELHGMAEMFVGTMHAFCIQLLQDEVPEFLRYSVLDESRQRMLVEREPTRSGFDSVRDADGNPLTPHADTRRYIAAIDVLRQAELDRSKLGELAIGAGLDQYRALLRGEYFLDYTGQLELAVDVLRRNIDAGQRLADRVKHVIVDEYQDTNALQEQLVRALAEFGATLTVVGDDDQTIFQWNGADVENILSFADRYPSARQLRLEANFRSSSPIVSFARDFVSAIDRRLTKAMQPTGAQPFERGDLLALSFANDWDEARFVARKLRELHGVAFTEGGVTRGLAWSDMAILLRGNLRWGTLAITRLLDQEGIPYAITGVKTLFERSEVRAACALFAFLAGDTNTTEAVLQKHWRDAAVGVTDEALARTMVWAHARRGQFETGAPLDRTVWRALGLQRTFLEALELLAVREESVPNGHGEEVFFNLGRFSGVLADFESLRSSEAPDARVRAFHRYVTDTAQGEHEEGLQASEVGNRDAVRITTVHRAKGLQWPVVILPGLGDGRFPMKEREQKLWKLVPRDAVRAPFRYESNEDDERRLFYVAITRAQKFLFATWAKGRYGKPAEPGAYFRSFAASECVSREDVTLRMRARAEARPRSGLSDVRLTFSQLKPMLECPYRFKLEGLYGFRAPLEEASGFGKSLHDALAEVHRRAIEGDLVTVRDVPRLLERHLHLPHASTETRARLQASASRVLSRYLTQHGHRLAEVELAEKPIEVNLGDGVSVQGRIDLAYRRRGDSDAGIEDDVGVVDLKSDHRAQSEELSDVQLRIYALGYKALTGRRPQRTEIWELDSLEEHASVFDEAALEKVRGQVLEAARRLRERDLPPKPELTRCAACASRSLCGARIDAAPELTLNEEGPLAPVPS